MLGCHHIRIIVPFFLVIALLSSCYKEAVLDEAEPWGTAGRVLELDHIFASCDKEDHILLYPLPSDTIISFSPFVRFGDYQSIEIDGRTLTDNKENDLGEVIINHPYHITASNGKEQENYQLYFTNLPVLHIHTDTKIVDEPKVLSRMELASAGGKTGSAKSQLFTSHAGIEIRGRTSAVFEKKSYGLELWNNGLGAERSESLLGMRNGEDWILDAMYVDPLRMRNKLSFEVWKKMWEHKEETPFHTTNPSIQCEYIELFINQRYMGIYGLSERLDEKLLNLNYSMAGRSGVLYKAIDWNGGATAFKTYHSEPGSSMIWEGWEQVYPEWYHWEPLAQLRKSVLYDSDDVFVERIDTLINLEAAAEYYLFVNLILAHDNIIKNYFLARYRDEPSLLLLPWDLEISWGIMVDGDPSYSHGLLENGLFNRLIELDVMNFNDMLENKWKVYRESIFQIDSLTASFNQHALILKSSGALDRENSRWPGVEIDLDEELQYLLQWSGLRLTYLDQYFE